MGLAADPNVAIPIPKTKRLLGEIDVAPVPQPEPQIESIPVAAGKIIFIFNLFNVLSGSILNLF